MATYYSDHFMGATHADLDIQVRASAGIQHGRLRYQRAEFTQKLTVVYDYVRMMQFKSSDRLVELFLTSTSSGSGANGTISVGLHKTGYAHDGAILDNNIFSTAYDVSGAAVNHVEILGTGYPDADLFRGKALWEVANMPSSGSAGLYPVDPMEDWDLVVTCAEIFADEATIILEAYYTSGD